MARKKRYCGYCSTLLVHKRKDAIYCNRLCKKTASRRRHGIEARILPLFPGLTRKEYAIRYDAWYRTTAAGMLRDVRRNAKLRGN